MTDNLNQLHSLLERLEKANGPDREIDAEILVVLGILVKNEGRGYRRIGPDGTIKTGWYVDLLDYWKWPTSVFEVEPLTASLDASVALVEKVLPGWDWQVGTCDSEQYVGHIVEEFGMAALIWEYGPNPALALLTAMVKALLHDT